MCFCLKIQPVPAILVPLIYNHFVQLLMELPLIVSSPQSDVTYVQGYTVKNINAPILKSIFKNHGDVAAN